jgi:electron transfer flavoprotein beta subunit
MKIIVCVKEVPDTETKIKLNQSGDGIATDGINWIVSPYDEFAIEEALQLEQKHGGEVVILTLGPERAQQTMRKALAMGADSAIHLCDPSFEGLDTLGTARALAAAIRGVEGWDLVLTGQQGVGGDNSQIPGLLAELLDVPQVTMAVKVEVEGRQAKVEREIEGAHESWEVALPAVLSAQKGLNEPRYASLMGIRAAKKKPLEVKDAAALGLSAEELQPQTKLVALELPPARPDVTMIEGDPAAQSRELLRLLREEAKVL